MGLFDFAFGYSSNNAQVGLNKWDTDWLYQQQSDRWRGNTEWYNLNGYSLMRHGLENAGYNPLMALGSSPLSGATVSGAAMDERTNATSFNSSGIPLGAQALKAQMRNVNADTTLKNAQTEENLSRSNLEITQKLLNDKDLSYKDKLMASQVIGVELDNLYKRAMTQNVKADTVFKRSQGAMTNAQIKQINATIDLLKNEKIISDRQAKWLKDHPEQAQLVTGIGQWTGAIGKIFGGNAGITKSIK